MQLAKIILPTGGINEGWQSKRGQITNSNLVRRSVFNNLGTEIGAADSSKVLLVALPVACILVENKRVPGFSLCFQNGIPEFLGLNGLTTSPFSFIPISIVSTSG